MTSQEFGELIRIQRESKGLTIEELAARFKLSKRTLRAIEEGSLENLPHAVYARGFVRSYAQAVGVNADDLEAGIEALFPRTLFEDVPAPPSPLSGRHVKGGKSFADKVMTLLIVLVVVGIPLGVGWFVYTHYGNDLAIMVKRPFSAIASSRQTPQGESPSASLEAGEREAPAAALAVSDAVSVPRAAAEQMREEFLQTPAAGATGAVPPPFSETAQRVEEPVSPPRVEGTHVGLQASEECWVEVLVDGEGKRMFTIYPGETSILPYKRKITVILGNSGGVAVTHNNEPYALAGKRNEKRTITFP